MQKISSGASFSSGLQFRVTWTWVLAEFLSSVNSLSETSLMLWFVTRESWDYVVLESSVIPANLGYTFPVWTQFLTKETGSMETGPIDLAQWRMNLLLFFLILRSFPREIDACPTSCSCMYDGSGLAELRFKYFSFCLHEIVYS